MVSTSTHWKTAIRIEFEHDNSNLADVGAIQKTSRSLGSEFIVKTGDQSASGNYDPHPHGFVYQGHQTSKLDFAVVLSNFDHASCRGILIPQFQSSNWVFNNILISSVKFARYLLHVLF
jgi:hypothetical protein